MSIGIFDTMVQMCHNTGMAYELIFAPEAQETLDHLAARDPKKLTKVEKCLGLLEQDPHYRSLQSHRFDSLDGVFGEKVWESYAENNTPSAWRVWWFFGPREGQISVVKIAAHP